MAVTSIERVHDCFVAWIAFTLEAHDLVDGHFGGVAARATGSTRKASVSSRVVLVVASAGQTSGCLAERLHWIVGGHLENSTALADSS